MNSSKSIQKYYMRAKRTEFLQNASAYKTDSLQGTENLNKVQIHEHANNLSKELLNIDLSLPNTSNDFSNYNDNNDISLSSNSCDGFRIQLQSWALRHNITHVAINDLLCIFKTPIPNLPSDARTLLGTKRTVVTTKVEPGLYYHFGLEYCLKKNVNNLSDSNITLNTIEININVDGLPLYKSSNSQVYPILCNIVGNSTVEMVGIYYGCEKPKSSNLFLAQFVDDAINIINNGIIINGTFYIIKIKAFVCDAPAKAFIKCIKNHTGYSSCSKCYIEGDYIVNRVCFPNVSDIKLRNDPEFRSKLDENHHNGTSIIENIPRIDMIHSFPLDYMHLICLGVVKKLLLLWCCGKPSTKLSFQKITAISALLTKLSPNVPREFNRKPRSLTEIKRWKATEFRQFLLYTNFIVLHAAVTILSQPRFLIQVEYASELLEYFVKTFRTLYGYENVSHNVHNLLHLTQDVKNNGVLDNFSTFPFENFLQSILRSLRKCDKPLEQIIKRHSEMLNENYNIKEKKTYPIFKNEYYATSLLMNLKNTKHFKTAIFKNFTLHIEAPDNCCCLTNGDVIIIKEIVFYQNKYNFVVIKYLNLIPLYESPCKSSDFGIMKANDNDLDTPQIYDIETVDYKCVQFKLNGESIIFPLMHTNQK
ncbi:hypothetical protein RN001_010150 [Aquatica leii]|uniref:Transposase domain-containing protein n=1 Tax=Aquatica leii TaxID=1421715 RepID=A0AAN7P618_9COLE|nr:hypothetical protein RN001_010150 [Aquatica leii]